MDAQNVPQVSFLKLSFAARRFLINIRVIFGLSLSRIGIGIDSSFYLNNTLRQDKQTSRVNMAHKLRTLQMRQENKLTK